MFKEHQEKLDLPRITNFTEASKEVILKELERILEDSLGCAPPRISYELLKGAIISGVGEIVSPFRMNGLVSDTEPQKYLHSIVVYMPPQREINFRCYTDNPIDKNADFIDISQLSRDPFDWPETSS